MVTTTKNKPFKTITKREGVCSKCDTITTIQETPSGFEICQECWDKNQPFY